MTTTPASTSQHQQQQHSNHHLLREHNIAAQVHARELNEQGAFCIDIGRYDRAIEVLIDALEVSESTNLDSSVACRCGSCSLDSCMQYSHDYAQMIDCKPSNSKACSTDGGIAVGGFMYRQPIRIPPGAVEGGHIMGMTLPMILTFNLALAYHLNAIATGSLTRNSNNANCRSHLEKILQLYELAYRWHVEEENQLAKERGSPFVSLSGILFTMVVANNLAQIHFAVNNITKYYLCLQHLLSTMMFLVDCQQLSHISTTQYHQNHQDPATTATAAKPSMMDLDGFLQNTSCLFLRAQAAAAA